MKATDTEIGHWQSDATGLPCFNYTGKVSAVGLEPNGAQPKMPTDPWFLLGNYQLTLFAHVSGELELITGQRAWGRMNQGKDVNSGSNRTSITIYDSHGEVAKEMALTDADKRIFGCGFARYSYNTAGLHIERRLSVAPSLTIDGGKSTILLTVKVKNNTRKAIRLDFTEAITANYQTIQYQRGGPIHYTNTYTKDAALGIVKADISGHSSDPLLIPAKDEMSMYEGYPPSLFIQLLSNGSVSASSEGELSATVPITLKKGEEKSIELAMGFAFDSSMENIDRSTRELIAMKDKNAVDASAFASQWKQVIPEFTEEKDADLRQELRWHAYTLEAMATYSSFYGETKIPQGTIYDYYWGQHASARDNFQHALPLVYYHPELARSVMRYMAQRTTPWGEIRLIEYGHGYAEGMVYNTSDQQLFFFMLLSEYLRVTKDYAFLDTEVEFFPKGGGSRGTMLDCVRNCFSFLKNNVGLGSHGLVRLLNSDWNDNVYVSQKVSYNNVIFSGESHMNTAMALSILANLLPQLEAYEGRGQMSAIIESMQGYRSRLLQSFMTDLGDSTFPRRMYFDGRSIGHDQMWLEPQGYLLQVPEFPLERKQTLYKEMQSRVYAGEKLGARQQECPEFSAPGLEDGSRENGGFWYSLNGPVIVGVASFDKAEAKRLLSMMTFKNYARQFPQYWTSYWSAADNVESSLMGPEEGLPDQSFDYAAIPIYCAHPHAWILYCYYRLQEK